MEAITPQYILNTILRRHWLIIISLLPALGIGIYLSIMLPKKYEARTLILVQPQRVPTSYVKSVVSIGIESRISTISQQIMSRTNLEKIIDQFKLFSEPEHENMFLEDKIDNMRKRISVEVTNRRGGADAFSISFKGSDQRKVMQVANTLATYFIDENLKAREAHAVGTSDFLKDELVTMKGRLEQLETALKNYREQHMGALPEQLETNLRVLDRLQVQLSEKKQSLRSLKEQLTLAQRQMSEAQAVQNLQSPLLMDDLMAGVDEKSSELENMNKQLEVFRTRYTDQHPDVVRLKKMISTLEEKIQQEPAEPTDQPGTNPEQTETVVPAFNFQEIQEAQSLTLKKEIHTLEAEIGKLNNAIQIYEARVEETPKREQELLSLNRDYNNINSTYNSLLQRKLESEIAVNMEKKQKGEQFRILDSAKLPEKPISPNMHFLFLATLAIGLGVGGGIIFLLEYFDTSFRIPKEIESVLDLSIIGTIPVICKASDIWKKRFKRVLSAGGIALSLGVSTVFYVICEKGVDQTIALLRQVIPV